MILSTSMLERLPETPLRVRAHTSDSTNHLIRARTDERVEHVAAHGRKAVDRRLTELSREWDIERVLQLNAGALALTGSLLGLRVDRRFLFLPAAVFSFFGQHALQGWCPPLPLLRRFGIRTVREIERERLALKALRGDFEPLRAKRDGKRRVRARAALAAVDR
jgi:hypothetical protein